MTGADAAAGRMTGADTGAGRLTEVGAAAWRILFVCTGNLCRSPVAERLMCSALSGAGAQVRVTSAGTRTYDGRPMEPNAARVLAELGGQDHPPFASRRLTTELVRDSDLILTAAREHRLTVCELEPAAWPRTFTLAEFARLLDTRQGPPLDPALSLSVRASTLIGQAAASRGLTAPARAEDDDIEDPIGGRYPVFRRGGAQIAQHVTTVASHLTGVVCSPPAPAWRERRWLLRR